MNPENKKYILENIGKKPVKEIASFLHMKERVIRRFLEKERPAKDPKDLKAVAAPQLKDTKANYFNILAIALIIIVGSAAYSNTFHSPFQFDDEWNIVNNPDIKNLSNLRAIFNFMPTRFITDLSLAINYHFGRNNVLGYHLFNLLVHLSAAIMVWWLVILTLQTPALRDKKIAGHSCLIAFFTALIFVSHPVQTQGVTYIIQRAASLAALFYISALAFYVKSRLLQHEEGRSHSRLFFYALSFIALILAMFSKEMTITLPLMILLYEVCFFREEGIDWKRVIPFLMTLIIIPITMVATKSVNFGEMRLSAQEGPGISPFNYLITQFRVIVTYLRLLLVPVNQNLDYDYSVSKTLFDIPTLSSLILLAVILIIAVRMFRKYRLISFGIFFFLLTLIPESSVIPIKDVIFEHRLYLPMVGYAIFLVSAAYYIFENKGIKPAIIILSIAGISYSMLTYSRNFIWKNEFTLWDDAVRKSPNKARPLNNRGKVYQDKGDIDQALSDYNKAIELNSEYADAYNNRGNAYTQKDNFDQALSDYNKAIELNPKYVDAYSNRGNAYTQKGNPDQGISDCNKAIEINPKYADAYSNRGIAYIKKSNFDQAISDCNKAIGINPKHADAYNNRGNAYINKGNFDQAISDCNKAIGINPKHADAYNNRGRAYVQKGNLDQSISDYNKAIEANPKHTDAYNNRGNAYTQTGNIDQALSDYNKAIEINPEYASSYSNRGAAYLGKGNFDQSISDCNKAIEINPKLAGAYSNRGNACMNKGNIDQALSDYNKAIEFDPKDANVYNNRAAAYLKKGNLDQSISDYNKAIELNHEYVDAYNNRAVAYFNKEQYVKSWEDVHSAQALGRKANPEFIEALKKASGREL
ncbi:MAG: tetratricopeptide repeat protein [Candidatus Omnitrophica bacterium]|nr:tetratricopeptide repeat protein [Candidatus Omnitrophota bacterium]